MRSARIKLATTPFRFIDDDPLRFIDDLSQDDLREKQQVRPYMDVLYYTFSYDVANVMYMDWRGTFPVFTHLFLLPLESSGDLVSLLTEIVVKSLARWRSLTPAATSM